MKEQETLKERTKQGKVFVIFMAILVVIALLEAFPLEQSVFLILTFILGWVNSHLWHSAEKRSTWIDGDELK